MKEFNNILVAVDFNDAVGKILGYAESLALKFNSKVWVIHVADPDPDFVGYEPGPQYIRDFRADELKEEHRQLQNISNMFLDKKIECAALLIQGSTVETVLKEVEKLHADLLIVGYHKHSFLHNLLSESVSMELLKNGNIPLLTIPVDED